MAVLPSDFWGLRIRDLFNESGNDAHQLVEAVAALRTTVITDLDFFIRIDHGMPLRIVIVFPTGSATVSSDIVVFIILRGQRPVGPRSSIAGWSVRILVFVRTCFEFFSSFVLLFEVFPQLIDPLLNL